MLAGGIRKPTLYGTSSALVSIVSGRVRAPVQIIVEDDHDALGQRPGALMTVSADEPPGLHVALAFHVDEPHRLRDEVVAQELPGRTRDLDLV